MTKIIKILSLVLCLELFLLSACTLHDSREKDMKKYMDSIDCEFEGYALIDEGDFSDTIKKEDCWRIDWSIRNHEYTFTFQERDIFLTENVKYDEQYKWCYSMIMMIDDEEIRIDHEYLKSHSETYNRIIKMWENDGYQEIIPDEIIIFLYHNNLFIAFHRISYELIWDWEGNLPVSLFHFDITDYSIKYVGYYEKYEYQGVYIYKR